MKDEADAGTGVSPMKSLLVYNGNSQYSLHHRKYPPIIKEIGGTDRPGVYVNAGDPIGFRHMCAPAVAHLLSVPSDPMSRIGESMPVRVYMIPEPNMTKDLHRAIVAAQRGEHGNK